MRAPSMTTSAGRRSPRDGSITRPPRSTSMDRPTTRARGAACQSEQRARVERWLRPRPRVASVAVGLAAARPSVRQVRPRCRPRTPRHRALRLGAFGVDLGLHRHDLAAQGGELLVARRHRRRAPAQQGLHDELENLNLAFGETVADPHGRDPSRHWSTRQWLTCHVASCTTYVESLIAMIADLE